MNLDKYKILYLLDETVGDMKGDKSYLGTGLTQATGGGGPSGTGDDSQREQSVGDHMENTAPQLQPPVAATGPSTGANTVGSKGEEQAGTAMMNDAHDELYDELKKHGIMGKTFNHQVRNFRKMMGLSADGGWDNKVNRAFKLFKEFRKSL